MSKTIILNEKQEKLLHKFIIREFMQQGFSFETFMNITIPSDRYNYCYEYLGEPIGEGSSRVAFEIDDAQVLKLAIGKYDAGCEQNKAEYDLFQSIQSPLLVKVLYHANDFSWLISERVIPCKEIDFYKVLGLPYLPYSSESYTEDAYEFGHQDLLGYRDYSTDKINGNDKSISYSQIRNVMRKMLQGKVDMVKENFPVEYNIITTHPWFQELYNLCKNYFLSIDDLGHFNLGLTMRNGKPTIVILDSGFTDEIGDKYY